MSFLEPDVDIDKRSQGTLSLRNSLSWRHLGAAPGSESPLLSERGRRSESLRRRENFLWFQTGRQKESHLTEKASVASCGLEQTHQMTGEVRREDAAFPLSAACWKRLRASVCAVLRGHRHVARVTSRETRQMLVRHYGAKTEGFA